MAQQNFTPTAGSTHLDARNIYNGNADDAESRLAALEGNQVVASDIDSETAPEGYRLTSDGAGNASWEAGGGAGLFDVVLVTGAVHTQDAGNSHHLYDDSNLVASGGDSGSGSGSGSGGASGPCMVVDLLPPAQHVNVTQHKKIGDSCTVMLLPPSGVSLDGIESDGLVSGYSLTSQYESISIFTDGTDYFIQ